MQVTRLAAYVFVGTGLLAIAVSAAVSAHDSNGEPHSSADHTLQQQLIALQSTAPTLATLKAPKLTEPEWLKAQNTAEQAAAAQAARPQPQAASSRVVTYDVMTRGGVTASLAEFKSLANATLNDSRGWARLGVSFQEVASGGMFTLVLSTADQVTSFSSGCGSEYSCRVGRFVIINQDRWMGATPSWNNAGGSLRDYRHMVVNHETGHWLGHGHPTGCSGAGQPAEVMQQQSMDLQGCTFNPWPVAAELWSSQLGIGR